MHYATFASDELAAREGAARSPPRDPREPPTIAWFNTPFGRDGTWAAGAVFMTLQACLGLEVDGIEQHVRFTRPQLPSSLSELRIHNLQVGSGTVDLHLVRHEHDVGVHVLRREGTVGVTVSK